MLIIFRKKIIFYIVCIASIVLLCMSFTGIIGNDNSIYSLFDVISKCSEEKMKTYTIQSIFSSGSSSFWLYLLLPVVTAIPMASFVSDERKSKFCMYEKLRGGTLRYLLSRLVCALASCAVALFAGLGIYMLVVCYYFDLEPVYKEGVTVFSGNDYSMAALLGYCVVKYGYLLAYCFAVSLLTILLVLLYNDLFFDISAAFILNYLFGGWFREDKVVYPLLVILFLLVAYIVLWKKGKKYEA